MFPLRYGWSWKYQLHVGIAHFDWKLYIYSIDCLHEDRELLFCTNLDSHKIVTWLFLSVVNYCLFMSCDKVQLQGLGVLLIKVIIICKHVRVFHGFSQVEDSYYKVIFSAIQSMGRIPLFQSIKIQNLTKSHFSNVDFVWKNGFRHKVQNKVAIETAYTPHVRVFEFL